MENTELQRTVDEVLAGDTGKFESIVLAYQKPIALYCCHMLGSYTEAEDSAQEVFFKAYRSLDKYSPEVPFGAWLYKIAYNQCIDVLRKRKLGKALRLFYQDETQHRPVDQQIEAKYLDEKVQRAMAKLSAEERNLLILRSVEEMSYQDISLILQQNSARLRKKYERAAEKFRKYYANAKGEDRYAGLQRQGIERNPS
ncbi:RNA polymerase [Paenibacillus sp. FSL R7-0273]|uniref:RNA polymerase sigma factor n=1 Tax=Paenibacillus sp. FSL R7-0273 TaxID=1536772 RepID=UPI0004F81F02|nr:sigma-70 family RNA polymerase sigma factor [Paenibacillus sp. FSL R7-0273]AIQ44701.1 RNA polymerase [Paenibacillus sp. FSL R7-0273]OMF93438.1 RNA polymerase [Paenibacillus sp. FSL R7-0273]